RNTTGHTPGFLMATSLVIQRPPTWASQWPLTARKGVESSRRLDRHRWVVERTVSWLSGCRRLHRRHERKPEHLLAFTSIAATLTCHRRITR
ncbi:hypothetical protein ACFYR3_45060, partial [Streptomyces sp. NPDC005784]